MTDTGELLVLKRNFVPGGILFIAPLYRIIYKVFRPTSKI